MKVAIMQPYFFPYLGYFQLMNAVDIFVVYDNVEFSKKGWIQRNRMLLNGKEELFSLPLKRASDFLDIRERHLADNYLETNKKTLRKLENAYSKAPNFKKIFPIIQKCFLFEDHKNLFEFLLFSIKEMRSLLNLNSELKVSSHLEGDERLKNKMRVIRLCQILNATTYINPIGGQKLYNKSEFENQGVLLKFLKMEEFSYSQQGVKDFVPWLSTIDVLMYNDMSIVATLLDKYELI